MEIYWRIIHPTWPAHLVCVQQLAEKEVGREF